MRIVIIAAALIVLGPLGGSAKADPYRWCMQFMEEGSSNCYFVTLEQCRAAASGNGICRPNPFYTGPDEPAPDPAKKKK